MLRHKWLRSRLTNWLPERGAEDVLVEVPPKWQVRRWFDVWAVYEPDSTDPYLTFQRHENAVRCANERAVR